MTFEHAEPPWSQTCFFSRWSPSTLNMCSITMNLIIHTGEVRSTVPCGVGIIRSSSLTKEEQHCHRSNTFQWLEMEILSIDIVQILFGGSFFNWFVTLRSVLYRWAPAFSLLDSRCPSLGIMAHLPHRAANHIPLLSKEAQRTFGREKGTRSPGSTPKGAAKYS